jgi:aminocarboxymuconate-semialdehyde decarboxylase
VAHGGGFAPYHKGRLQTALRKRPWADGLLVRPFDELWAQLSFDTAVHHHDALRFLIEAEGADRVLLGSNFAGWDVEDRYQELIAGLRLSPAAQVAVLGGNAKRIFNLA